MADDPVPNEAAVKARKSCSECQRRKQKCNRQWPCNHCTKRKIGDRCQFGSSPPSTAAGSGIDNVGRKRQYTPEEVARPLDEPSPFDEIRGKGFEAMGYTANHYFNLLTGDVERESHLLPPQYYETVKSCPALDRACQIIPARPYTDLIIQNFFQNVNFHYYIIYPEQFMRSYQAWWKNRADGKPLSVHWTCLLLMICACSLQYTTVNIQKKVETDLASSVQKLSELYHNTGRELHSTIPIGNNHLLNVQTLLHSCYWFKGEIRFLECWHMLARAILEAQELGMHQESRRGGHLNEFEREMRRRVWCILNTWDWGVSALLSRPLLIDRSDCDISSPSLSIEGYRVSPLLPMKLQSELIGSIARQFGQTKLIVNIADIQKYQSMLRAWITTLPEVYQYQNPDISLDEKHPWIKLHRYYIQTFSNSMFLDPIRPYFVKPMSKSSLADELELRNEGVTYALRLMDTMHKFFEHVYPRDSKYHFVLFTIFDTATILCSALIHDEDSSIPQRDAVHSAINGALSMMDKLATATPAAKTSSLILARLVKKLRTPQTSAAEAHSLGAKRPRMDVAVGSPQQPTLASDSDPNLGPHDLEESGLAQYWNQAGSPPEVQLAGAPFLDDSTSPSRFTAPSYMSVSETTSIGSLDPMFTLQPPVLGEAGGGGGSGGGEGLVHSFDDDFSWIGASEANLANSMPIWETTRGWV